jgi:hypothetical protein
VPMSTESDLSASSTKGAGEPGRMYFDHTLGAYYNWSNIPKVHHGELRETQIRTGSNEVWKGTYLRICGCMGLHGGKLSEQCETFRLQPIQACGRC